MLSKFWLVNGGKKTGKKSTRKVKLSRKATKVFAKKIKKSVVKKGTTNFTDEQIKKLKQGKTIRIGSKKIKIYKPRKTWAKPQKHYTVGQRVIVPEIMPTNYVPKAQSLTDFTKQMERERAEIRKLSKKLKNKKTKATKKAKSIKRGVKTMARKIKRAKRAVAKRKMKRNPVPNTHRIVARKHKGRLYTSKKARIVKKGLKLNPIAGISTRGLVNQIKPVAILGGVSVASMIGINKAMDYIPYIKNMQGISKSISKVGVGVAGMIVAKKLVKNQVIANGILLGAIISAIADVLATRNVTVANSEALNGVKVFGNPALQYGRPTAPLGTQSYKGLNGIKVRGVNGVKGYTLPAKVETMQGAKEAELY